MLKLSSTCNSQKASAHLAADEKRAGKRNPHLLYGVRADLYSGIQRQYSLVGNCGMIEETYSCIANPRNLADESSQPTG